MLNQSWYRIKQFWFGMTAVYNKDDETFASNYLNIKERALFKQLPGFEKKHAIVVAHKMLAAAYKYPDLDQRKLARLGLLHDVGKVLERSSIFSKSVLVMIRFISPWLYRELADVGEHHKFFRRFYIHKHHGAVGAKLLEKLGENSEILAIIAKHDPLVEPFGPQDPIELKILQDADSTY